MTAAGLTFFGEDDLSRPWPSAPCSNPTRRRRRLVWRKMVPFWTWTKGWKEPMEIYSSFVYCWFWSGKDKRSRLFLWKQSGLNSQKQIRIIISTKQHGGFCAKGKLYQKPRVLLELHSTWRVKFLLTLSLFHMKKLSSWKPSLLEVLWKSWEILQPHSSSAHFLKIRKRSFEVWRLRSGWRWRCSCVVVLILESERRQDEMKLQPTVVRGFISDKI